MSVAADYDSPWKEALRLYLHSFMRVWALVNTPLQRGGQGGCATRKHFTP